MLGQTMAPSMIFGHRQTNGMMPGIKVHGLTKTHGMNMDHGMMIITGTIMDHGMNNTEVHGLITDHSVILTVTHTLPKLKMRPQA